MDEEPDRIRNEIEATRTELSRDVNALADRTSPRRVARRRWTAAKQRVRGISDRVMGTPDGRRGASSAADAGRHAVEQVGEQARQVAGDVADTARRGPEVVARQTQGNPVAAGVIAFGVGLLTASLIPVTEVERRAGQRLADQGGELVEPVRRPLAESARQLKDDLSGSVTDAAQRVKQRAAQGAQATVEQTRSSTQATVDETRDAVRRAG
jgi:hypothetical protein